MSRYRTYNGQDDQPARDGDTTFVGVYAKASPERLTAGLVQSALNMTFREGSASTRKGASWPGFGKIGDQCALFAGSGIYSDPYGVEWILVATDVGVWKLRQGSTPRLIPTPEPLAAGTYCELVQCFNQVLLFRGPNAIPWVWNGQDTGPFIAVSQAVTGDGTKPIPNGTSKVGLRPALLNNRLIVPHGRTNIAISDLLDYTRYDDAFADFDVTTGNDDTLTALYPFTGSTLLCFKDQSVAAVNGISGTLATVALEIINREVGCTAGKTVGIVGGDVFFLSGTGVFRLTQIIQDRLQTAPIAVSDPIQPIMGRINWAAAAAAVAAVAGDYYLLAVPLDGSPVNNAILPYNTVTGAWEGIHILPNTQIDALLVTDWNNERRLYAIDYAARRVLLLYDGLTDCIDVEYEIEAELVTRGYLLGENGFKMFRRALLAAETWRPAFAVSALTDGVNEERSLGPPRTRSRTLYWTGGKAPWNPTNVNDDHGTSRRQDYSWPLSAPLALQSGVVPELHQSAQDRYAIGRRGRWCALRIRNTQGSIRISSVEVGGDETQRTLRTAA